MTAPDLLLATVTKPAAGPPALPFVLTIGVTGHRSDALTENVGERLEGRVHAALQRVVERAKAARLQEGEHFSDAPERFILISPLADGSDQVTARVALDLGFELHVILPFTAADYREQLPDEHSRIEFDALVGRAACTLELPGRLDRQLEAFVMTGRATVAHCDLLVAVWDGLPPRGRGGTGEVVELALVNGTPVLHLPVDPTLPPRLLWSAFDPAIVTHELDDATERPFDQPTLDMVLTTLLAPPQDPQERHFLALFRRERSRRIRTRIEYPLLLAAAGVARFDRSKLRQAACAAQIRTEWSEYRRHCADAHQLRAALDLVETSYSWADQLATHFAQTYRSGHIFNFLFGGIAVCLGLSGFMAPGAVLQLAIAEFVITLGIIVNTQIGVKNEWHRRWLDYRQLAERLRPMRSLKLLGLAAPDPPGTATNPVPRRWIDWYAAGVWRAMGCPAGVLNDRRAAELSKAIAAFEVAPQVAYHERHAEQIDLFDRRLEHLAGALFMATLIVTVVVTLGLWFRPAFVLRYSDWFTLVSAGFPALGTAVFGIRFQGDFGGSAIRSRSTANALRLIESELSRGVSLQRASDLTEQAARIMHSDLDEWRLVNQQQELDLV